jgi:serine/threonine protein phosphatase PrpC
MADFVIHVGSRTAQGVRPNNEDRYVVDLVNHLFLVADGMGGQDLGEQASGLAAEIIPRVVHDRLAARDDAGQAMQKALAEANVVALQQAGQLYVAGLGDSRAYLIRGGKVQQLTVDHSVAQALVLSGALTPEEARHSPWQHVLHKFLGCKEAGMSEGTEIRPLTPQAGDRLLLASDGLTNHVSDEDLLEGARRMPHPQEWADHLVSLALERGSRDNVTCVVVAFDPA